MEALMQVMATKKREVSAVREKKSSLKEKYLRRCEVESLLEEQVVEKKAEDGETTEKQQSKKRKLEDKTTTKVTDGEQSVADKSESTKKEDDDEIETVLSWPTMRRRLRELGEPITFFGENLKDRMARLRRAEMDAATKHEEALGAGHNIRNRFVGGNEGDTKEIHEDFDTTVDEERTTKDEEDEHDGDKMVYKFFRGMLQRWERDLAHRPEHVKRTAQGKLALKTMKQCKDYIRPLFKLCKLRQVPSDIRPNLVEIVQYCRQGEFVLANDAYIRLAIGNAAWPIGVTMVGIHERTGREKIHSNKQAHVMNNEAQRKYLTSVKRLISYAQSVSNVMPSKRVL